MEFNLRLKQIRESKHMTQDYISKTIGITVRQYQRYEAGTSEPTASVIIALADCFNVSADYLLGRSNNPVYEPCKHIVDNDNIN